MSITWLCIVHVWLAFFVLKHGSIAASDYSVQVEKLRIFFLPLSTYRDIYSPKRKCWFCLMLVVFWIWISGATESIISKKEVTSWGSKQQAYSEKWVQMHITCGCVVCWYTCMLLMHVFIEITNCRRTRCFSRATLCMPLGYKSTRSCQSWRPVVVEQEGVAADLVVHLLGGWQCPTRSRESIGKLSRSWLQVQVILVVLECSC